MQTSPHDLVRNHAILGDGDAQRGMTSRQRTPCLFQGGGIDRAVQRQAELVVAGAAVGSMTGVQQDLMLHRRQRPDVLHVRIMPVQCCQPVLIELCQAPKPARKAGESDGWTIHGGMGRTPP